MGEENRAAAEATQAGGFTRLSFIRGSATVAGGAIIAGVPAAVVLDQAEAGKADPHGVVTKPSSAAPREPVMAYVRDAERGEVTVLAGIHETTYIDKALTNRLLAAAAPHSILTGGGADVVAP